MLERYIDQYLANEASFRKTYGGLTYFSKLVVFEKDGAPLPVAPWGEFSGEPLVLPDPDRVQHLAVSWVDDGGNVRNQLLNLRATLDKIATRYKVETIEAPVKHTVVRIKTDEQTRKALMQLLLPT